MKITGKAIQFSDIPNSRGMIYKKDCIDEDIFQRLRDTADTGMLLGEFFHDYTPNNEISLANVSHIVTKLEKTDNELITTVRILETPRGNLVRTALKLGLELSIKPRMLGTIEEDGTVNVKEILSFDLVEGNDGSFCPDNFINKRYIFSKKK
jgi:hypothetical protein